MTDIFSGWTENRATWNKGALGVMAQIKGVESMLPFPLLRFDCDNGSEFLNHPLHRYLANRPFPAQFTRSRPYRKNVALTSNKRTGHMYVSSSVMTASIN